MTTMRVRDNARSFNWELNALRNSCAIAIHIKLLFHIDMPSFIHIAGLRVAKWISNAAALNQKLRPLWEVRPLFNSWRIMTCWTCFTCFYLCCFCICIIDFLIKPFFTELACVCIVSMLTSSASFAADLCFHWSFEFVCFWMCSCANLWLNWCNLLDSMIFWIAFSEFNMVIIKQARWSVDARSFSDAPWSRILANWTRLANIYAALSEFIMVSWTQKALTLFFIWHTSVAYLTFFVHGLRSNHLYPFDLTR